MTRPQKIMLKKKIRHKGESYKSNLTFRSMPELGFEHFVAVVTASIENTTDLNPSQYFEAWKKDLLQWCQREGYDPSIWVVGFKDDEAVGFVIPRLWEKGKWTDTDTGDILEIGVMPKHRRRGYGEILLRKGIASLAEKGAEEVVLWVDATNEPALNLYKKVGFVVSCEIRTATTKDSAELIRLADELIHLDDRSNRELMLNNSIQDPNCKIFVAEADQKIVGFIEMRIFTDFVEGSPIAIITNLIVEKNYRKLGIGSKLIERTIEDAEKQNAIEIHVWTEFDNQQAINFYTKHGFKKRALLLEKET